MLKINEIYQSIQGESSFTGIPCVFIRLTGCNLRCTYCDTEYAFYEGNSMTLREVVSTVQGFGLKHVEITGGEPLMQKDVFPLMEELLSKGYRVLLETGGSISLKNVPPGVIRIMDFKCPGSGEEARNDYGNLDLLVPGDEVKFVILDRADYEWSRNMVKTHALNEKAEVLFSSVHDKLPLKDLANWILEDKLPVRLQLQLHKVIWDKNAIGV